MALGLLSGLYPPENTEIAISRIIGIFLGVVSAITLEVLLNQDKPIKQFRNQLFQVQKYIIPLLSSLYSAKTLYSEQFLHDLWKLRLKFTVVKGIQFNDPQLQALAQEAIGAIRIIYHHIYQINLFYSDDEYVVSQQFQSYLSQLLMLLKTHDDRGKLLALQIQHAQQLSEKVEAFSKEGKRLYRREALFKITQQVCRYFQVLQALHQAESQLYLKQVKP